VELRQIRGDLQMHTDATLNLADRTWTTTGNLHATASGTALSLDTGSGLYDTGLRQPWETYGPPGLQAGGWSSSERTGTMTESGQARSSYLYAVDSTLAGDGTWQVVVGGAAGKKVRKADLLITVESSEEALQAATLFFQYYRENANYLERTYDFIERFGIEKVRRETVYAPLAAQQGLRERLRNSKRIARDAWLEGDEPHHPSQFVQIQPVEKVLQ